MGNDGAAGTVEASSSELDSELIVVLVPELSLSFCLCLSSSITQRLRRHMQSDSQLADKVLHFTQYRFPLTAVGLPAP